MIERGERRALPAGPYVGRAEIEGDGNAEQLAHQATVAELAGRADPTRLRGAMQHRLAVKTDNADIGGREPRLGDKIGDGRRLGAGQRFLGRGEDGRIRPFEVPPARLSQRLFEQVADGLRIGHQRVGTETLDGLAVGAQQRHIDVAVEHGSGHQAHGPDRLHDIPPSHH